MMKPISFDFKNTLLPARQVATTGKRLAKEIARVSAATKKGYDTEYASINLPVDKKTLEAIEKEARKHRGIDALVIVGIGGSNLGTMAIQHAVLGKLHNELADKRKLPKVYYADTVDNEELEQLADILNQITRGGGKVLINAVSKSGGTTETIANLEFLLRLVLNTCNSKQGCMDLVVTTDENSKLWAFAKARGVATLAVPKLVGGRYSVFSAVGLFPLSVLGLDVEGLLAGAASMRTKCLSANIKSNPAAMSAIAHYLHSKKRRTIANMFLFATDLEDIGKWYRQLMGESLGKEWNKQHSKKIHAGITPTIAIGSTDLHSMAQLYLGGPDDKFTTFVTVKELAGKERGGITLPKWDAFNELVPHIQQKRIPDIMQAIIQGVLIAYKKRKRPFCTVTLPGRNMFALGQLLQFKMCEMIYLGALLDINPFTQPAVESYKTETKRILARKRTNATKQAMRKPVVKKRTDAKKRKKK